VSASGYRWLFIVLDITIKFENQLKINGLIHIIRLGGNRAGRRLKKAGQTVGLDAIKSVYLQKKPRGGDPLGSVIKKRRKKMRKHKHRKLLARTRHQRRKGK
jgi:hypothetical protein